MDVMFSNCSREELWALSLKLAYKLCSNSVDNFDFYLHYKDDKISITLVPIEDGEAPF